ncbi:MAG: hypothetical protein ABEK17_04370 [Candidatus Aenigmatarchaeota archaeon]
MKVRRFRNNPVLEPVAEQVWQKRAVFNGCPVEKNGKIYLLYRALSSNHYHNGPDKEMELSTIGIAESEDGRNFNNRKQFVVPEKKWEKFGCEDPRITKMDGKYYIFYTALSKYPLIAPEHADAIKVGLAITEDLETIDEKHLITPFNCKAMSLFLEKINGKYWTIFNFHPDAPPSNIYFASFEKESDMWSKEYWRNWYKNRDDYLFDLQGKDGDRVEVGTPPIKTKHGWLLFYSYARNYFTNDSVFTIEAALLDLDDPTKVISRTNGPIMTPNKYYEKDLMVNNVAFPSGALKKGDQIYLYYGAGDTVCSLSFVDLPSLFDQMLQEDRLQNLSFKRFDKNPVITPNSVHEWESKSTFNPAAVKLDDKVHLIYRAMSNDNTSRMGYAISKDGVNIDYRSEEPVYEPRENFEMKKKGEGNSGCEDPRLTRIGDKIYMFYTAYDSVNPPRVAMTSIEVKDFLDENCKWENPVLISPPGVDDKDAGLFPEKINGKYYILHRAGNGIDLSVSEDLDFKGEKFVEETGWMEPRKGWWDSEAIGIASPPIKTDKGWILLYHGISEDRSYHVGAALLDLDEPSNIIARTNTSLLDPEEDYEKNGDVPNVVFPCGSVVIDGKIYIYYGGADKVVGVAKMKMENLLEKLEACRV